LLYYREKKTISTPVYPFRRREIPRRRIGSGCSLRSPEEEDRTRWQREGGKKPGKARKRVNPAGSRRTIFRPFQRGAFLKKEKDAGKDNESQTKGK